MQEFEGDNLEVGGRSKEDIHYILGWPGVLILVITLDLGFSQCRMHCTSVDSHRQPYQGKCPL